MRFAEISMLIIFLPLPQAFFWGRGWGVKSDNIISETLSSGKWCRVSWLHACGKFALEIAKIVGRTPVTVRKVIKNYQKGGIELVSTIDSNHPASDLEAHRASIVEEFKPRPPASAKEAAARIEKMTGISRSAQRVRIFLKKIGMDFRKTAAIPAKADKVYSAKTWYYIAISSHLFAEFEFDRTAVEIC
ncbi:hypothetical protein LJC47_03850 [Desulfosarcina sp. OttesenSCG-928-B08]|nr:hypothetical protein [Desulfosarcina sp. OttesenSCG-928-B08]